MLIQEFYNNYPSIVVTTQEEVYKLEATDFERLCQAWSMERFPHAKVTRGPTNKGDQGVDIEVIVGGMTPMHIVIQAKCWDPTGPNVSIKVVNETAGAAVAKRAGYAIIITTGGFTKEAKLQATKQEGNVKMTLLDGDAFWASLLKLPEYSKRMIQKSKLPSLKTSTSAPILQKCNGAKTVFTNHGSFTFGSKIEQKIVSDKKLQNLLLDFGICCFQDFLFLSQQKNSRLSQLASTLSTGSKLALADFLRGEITELRSIYQTRLQKIRQQVKIAQNLEEVFNILDMDENTRSLFFSSDGVGQNFDKKDNPQVLCAIEKKDFEKLLVHIESETNRHELIVAMNVITGKSQEELEGSVLNVSITDDIVAKFKLVDVSNGKIK